MSELKKTNVSFGVEAMEGMLVGANVIIEAVGATLGPDGRYTIISKTNQAPHATKDGFKTAQSIDIEDPLENAGAKFVQEAAMKTVKEVGDGTSTTTVLAGYMMNEGFKAIKDGANPVELKAGMEDATVHAINKIREISKPVGKDSYREIATISANNDAVLGGLIGDAMEEVTADGVIRVEPSYTGESHVDFIRGIEFDSGYVSPHLMNNPGQGRAEWNNPKIVLTEDAISSTDQILPLLTTAYADPNKQPLVIIAGDITGEALATITTNAKGGMPILAIKAYGQGSERKDFLEDLAVLTGASVMSSSLGKSLLEIESSDYGYCDSIHSDRVKTTVLGSKGEDEAVNLKAEEIRAIRNTIDKSDRYHDDYYRGRLARILGKAAIIKIASSTDVELKETLDRLEDALYATMAATEQGVVPGGGTTFLKISESVVCDYKLSKDYRKGYSIVKESLYEPIRRMSSNVGIDAEVILAKIKKNKGNNYGFNFKTKKYCDMLGAGILDPAKSEIVSFRIICKCFSDIINK